MIKPVIITLGILLSASAAVAQTVYPIDRAEILSGAQFDFKVEFPDRVDQSKLKVTVNGEDYAAAFGRAATFIEREDGKEQSALMLRDVTLAKPGSVVVEVSDGTRSRKVTWNVYDTGPRKAKNVILLIGDGMSLSHRVAARLLSKGIAEGKSFGKLAMDDMPHMALVATAGSDSIITDSANSASAYGTGHKSAVNAMGVYADRTKDPFDDPRVETIASLAKRRLNMGVGIVTNTEIEDATPAAMVAHTRRRAAYDEIVGQLFAAKPDVLMGGGSANFLPQAAAGKRKDDTDYIARFRDAGYQVVMTKSELDAAAACFCVGKGVGSPQAIAEIETLAARLGAAVGASRDVTDAGWLPKNRQIGLTGRAIAPRLLIEIGVRGAFEHMAGSVKAGVIVALNANERAPIFEHADVGVVGDWRETLPPLVAGLEGKLP